MYKGEERVVEVLRKRLELNEIAKLTSLNVDSVRRIVESLRDRGYVNVERTEELFFERSPELENYIKNGFPEEEVFEKALKNAYVKELSPPALKFGLKWAKEKGWVKVEKGTLIPLKDRDSVARDVEELKTAVEKKNKPLIEELVSRHLLIPKKTVKIFVRRTDKPYKEEKRFDFNVRSADAEWGKPHVVSRLIFKIKKIFSEMGFEEMSGPVVESAFWNFDALFQPQDHPAREMQDTFYVDDISPLPQDEVVERVKHAHEKGWGYSWKRSEAQKTVLRTHTTALSSRYLASHTPPKRFFAIGKVFRNEAIDYRHLAEFYQVEGIVAWENATFRDLLGILSAFYKKLGFEKIRFRPSYFPYTEPSLEIEVFFDKKDEWIELGGAGIFRPEVSLPLCNSYPVLAWGLSLERPLMIMLGLTDIRELYKNDADFLKRTRLEL